MNHKQLVSRLADRTHIEEATIDYIFRALRTLIVQTLAKGEQVTLGRLATFSRQERTKKGFTRKDGRVYPAATVTVTLCKVARSLHKDIDNMHQRA